LHANVVPIQLPIGREQDFCGVVDLIAMTAYFWDATDPNVPMEEGPIPADLQAEAEKQREHLIENLAEFDDELMNHYLNDGIVEASQLIASLHNATIAGKIFPVLCGTALKNKGIQPLLDAILRYFPSPLEVPPIKGLRPSSDTEELIHCSEHDPLSVLVFKIMSHAEGPMIYYARVYSGILDSGSRVYNPGQPGSGRKGIRERVLRMLRLHANKVTQIKKALPGEIVGIIGLKDTTTGDTLCNQGHPIILDTIEHPEPVIFV
jgi:elongation factor G